MTIDKYIENRIKVLINPETCQLIGIDDVERCTLLRQAFKQVQQYTIKSVVGVFKCSDCAGYGSTSTPSNPMDICNLCEGTGFNSDGCCNDIVQDVVGKLK